MIPKLLHQTSKDGSVPASCRGYQEKVRTLHPDWQYQLWSDQDNLQFVRDQFPDMLELYQNLPKNIMRADVIRYLWMYRLGGLYLDLDFEMLRPFEFLDKEVVLPWEIEGELVANAIIAAEPGHPFFKMVIDDLKANPPLAPDSYPPYTTGPQFLSRILVQARQANLNIFTPAPEIFSPPTPRSPRQYRKIVHDGVAHGIHHCYGSWVDYTLPQRIRNRLVSAIKWFT
jgi:mannosyltransferase OCH1-like enzyme